ncbi:phosphoglycerate mutase-like protein 4 [Phtheirospermum japonicum]|uniref:Phosphoglycerate mutase-like protein 4 n=1 Tax=Phtheirospermum japonicum TaxID=374723 RepID=A0A830CF60_9LAMI|nr:phosphoglycerate mutase-like protein 4 [Phtheirospermum japonicum]
MVQPDCATSSGFDYKTTNIPVQGANCKSRIVCMAVTKDPDLRERHLGDLQGVVFQELAKVNPKAHKAFVSNRDDQEIPGGGESFNQLYDRCTSALAKDRAETQRGALLQDKINGHLDVDLNDVGRQQAVAVAERLSKEPKISAVYSSDLKRAFYTAEIIANSCGVLEVTKDPDLRERHLGDLQGVVFQELAKVNPKAHKAFVSNRDDQEIPLWQRIALKHRGERVVVVSHGGTIRALHKRASPHRRSTGRVMNTSVSVFLLTDGGKWIIKSWGDVSHLDGTGFLESGFGGDQNSG